MSEETLKKILLTTGYTQQTDKHAVFDYIKQLLQENKQLKEQNEKEFADYTKFKREQYDEYLDKINKLIKEKEMIKKISSDWEQTCIKLEQQLDLYKNVIDKIKIELHFWNTWVRHNNLQHPFHDDMEKFVFDVEKILLEILDKVDEESDKDLQQENEHYKHIIDELEKRIDKCAEEIINELNENHHLSCGVALGIRQRLINYRELKGSDKE